MAIQTQTMRHENLYTWLLARPIGILQAHRRAYMGLNVFYYGLIVVGMIYAMFNPALQQSLMQSIGTVFTQGPFAALTDAYMNAKIFEATGLTFLVNLFIGSLGTITLPSLLVPFSGLLMGAYRAFLWGVIYAPTSPEMQTILLPHSLTLILEGQAYILAMLGVVIQGSGLLLPRTVGATNRKQGLWMGIKLSAQLYVLVILVLAVAAIYEVLEAVWLLATLQ